MKDGEERRFVAFVDGEFAGHQAYVGCRLGQALALLLAKSFEDRHPADLLRRYHGRYRVRGTRCAGRMQA
jgi:hypothetical protein